MSVNDCATTLTCKQVHAAIQGFEIKENFFSNEVLFQVVTSIAEDNVEWSVHRNDDDFYELRKLLAFVYPYMLVPALITKDTDT